MIVIKKDIETQFFKCEVCNREYTISWSAEACERSHRQNGCSHENYNYELIMKSGCYEDGCGSPELLIEKKCLNCLKSKRGEIDIDKLGISQENLKELFEGIR